MIKCNHCQSVDNYETKQHGPHLMATCKNCGKYIKFLPQNKTTSKLHFGKYQGREIISMRSEEEIVYLKWLITLDNLKSHTKEAVKSHLVSLNRL